MVVESIFEAIATLFSWPTFGWVLIGVPIGVIVGALPGVGSSLGMAIILPLTLPLQPTNALILLVSVYSGSMYGGSVSAILVNVPGTGGSAATTLDGYPMSQNGQAMQALAIAATGSAIAGFVSVATLFVLSPVIIEVVLAFGSPEYFLMAVLGIAMITVVVRGSLVKGLISGAFGLMITTIGIAPNAPELRFTFGSLSAFDGVDFIAALIGVFAIAEIIKLAAQEGGITDTGIEMDGNVFTGIKTVLSNPLAAIKYGYIGMFIGAIPGAGATVANFFAYGEAVRSSKDEASFGGGNPMGVLATEASNNGTIGGSLIPTLSFGIPGSGATAVLLGALLMHGINPGPELFADELATTYSFLLALLIGNVLILIGGVFLVTKLGIITQIDTHLIIPIVVVLSVIGGYALDTNWFDVGTLVILGILGYFMIQHDYSVIALLLGVILGEIAEENLITSLIISQGSFDIFITRPISATLVALTLFILLGPFIVPKIKGYIR